ncbi:Hypothetical protein CINCED_3A021414 [Cinara cedri]|uniref:Uncharacterized protein n=1 Tax=Cinara cedri TaxID=506608 RepID=A0A5E4M0G8_9HEMI|nr:Hypothetical protein CINCED_3A021414 [Cinara cedri]
METGSATVIVLSRIIPDENHLERLEVFCTTVVFTRSLYFRNLQLILPRTSQVTGWLAVQTGLVLKRRRKRCRPTSSKIDVRPADLRSTRKAAIDDDPAPPLLLPKIGIVHKHYCLCTEDSNLKYRIARN